jgi:RNA polymerase sigma-70 factor (ECF subfamily)
MHASLRAVAGSPDEGAVAEHSASFEDFFHVEHARLFRALCLVTGSRQEAEEIAQDSFLKLWERWDRASDIDDRTAYLYRTAMNAFRSRYRSTMRAVKRAMAVAPVPDDAFAAVENRDVVIRALRGLIPQQRAAIVLTALLGYSSEEAGQMLGIKASTVRALSTRARTAMRERVGEPT